MEKTTTITAPKFNGFETENDQNIFTNLVKETLDNSNHSDWVTTFAVNRAKGKVTIVIEDVCLTVEQFDNARLLYGDDRVKDKIRQRLDSILRYEDGKINGDNDENPVLPVDELNNIRDVIISHLAEGNEKNGERTGEYAVYRFREGSRINKELDDGYVRGRLEVALEDALEHFIKDTDYTVMIERTDSIHPNDEIVKVSFD